MPTAPQGLTPTAAPSGFAPEVNLGVPVDAFGGAVGHALEGLGGHIEQASDRIWSRAVEMQGLENETRAKEADAKYMMKSGIMHADFINKEGLNAGPDALQKHIQDLQDLRVNIRNELGNPAAQRMYDASSLGFMGRNIFNAAGHSGQQMKVASNGAADARIDGLKTNIGNNPEDDVGFARGVQAIRSENARKAANSGWTPEQLDMTNRKDISEAVARRAIALGDNKSAIVGQRYLDLAKKNGAIDDVTADKVQATLTNKFNDQGSRIISDKVLVARRNGDEENRPVQEYIDEGLKEAEKYSYKDPMFPDHVRQRIVTDYNRQKAIETDMDNMNTRIIGRAINTPNKEGLLPTTIEQAAVNDPQVLPAWDAIQRNPQKAQAVRNQFKQNAANGRIAENDENQRLFWKWHGQGRNGNDQEQAEFMAHDFGTETTMTLGQKGKLHALQEQKQHTAAINAQNDPRVRAALEYLKPDWMAANKDTTDKIQRREDWFAFTGALQDQLDQFHHDNPNKTPDHEWIRKTGAALMQQDISKSRYGSWFDTKEEPIYKQPVPEEDAKKIRNDPYWQRRNITPNDSMIARIWRADKFKEKFGGSAGEVQFPPNAPGGGL